jgi:hypothetical protein
MAIFLSVNTLTFHCLVSVHLAVADSLSVGCRRMSHFFSITSDTRLSVAIHKLSKVHKLTRLWAALFEMQMTSALHFPWKNE